MKLIQIVFFSLFRSSEVKIGSRIGLQVVKVPSRSELLHVYEKRKGHFFGAGLRGIIDNASGCSVLWLHEPSARK